MFDENNNHLIYMYKYLGLKHRSENKLYPDDDYKMNREISRLIKIAICDSSASYFMNDN